MQTATTYLELIRERGKKGLPLERVYRHLFQTDLFLMAYGKIYRNTGAMTHGVTDETPDGMSLEKIAAIIKALRFERYHWLPARRTYIPKKNGKKRPLGMPVWSDKLVQEVIRLILEAYYEPTFSDHSHGFRPERGCHTALREIYSTWHGTTWFIEGDISQCFDKLDHRLLLQTISEKIHDGRFIKLLRELLDAGYMEEWTYHRTLSGVPQGGIVSPLLTNILLDKLDKFVETVLIPRYTKGQRRANPEYKHLMEQSRYHRKRGNSRKAEELRTHAQTLPSYDVHDPNFRRLKYVRYADDFLLGFTGPKSEAEAIKQELGRFLKEELKLELAEAKTLITHARTEAAQFLGYHISTMQDDTKRTLRDTNGYGIKRRCRSINSGVKLHVPKAVVEAACKRYRKGKKAIHRKELMELNDYSIVMHYQLEYRGLVNYYRLAHNLHTLNKLRWVMQQSLTKTLAHKHKLSVKKVYEKYGAERLVNGKKYKTLRVVISREKEGKDPLVAYWGGIPLMWDITATLEEKPSRAWFNRSELVQRMLAECCELCGSSEEVQVHHVRKMSHLHEYPGREKPEWVKRMITMKHKTIILCRTCHEDVDLGRPLRRQTINLTDVKARQKWAMRRY